MDRVLPMVAAFQHPTTNDMIFVMAGKSGYWEKESLGVVDDTMTADKWNAAHNVTKAEAAAMFGGSMWGWNAPAASPDNYDENGEAIQNFRLDD